jgi:hypothetical protein
MPLDFFPPDDECCAPALSKSLESGALEGVTEWTHEKCGQLWRAQCDGEMVRVWVPVCDVVVFQ